MNLYVPDIGDTFILTEPWHFTLWVEHRNGELLAALLANRIGREYEIGDVVDSAHYRVQRDDPRYADMLGVYRRTKLRPDSVLRCCGEGHSIDPHGPWLCPKCGKRADRIEHVWPPDYEMNIYKEHVGHVRLVCAENARGYYVTLPPETHLKVDRIYIRKGSQYRNFSSLSFIMPRSPHPDLKDKKGKECFGRKGFRFWAKLCDVNTITCARLCSGQINDGGEP